jgi:uncharacterized protein (DUF111 family)
VSNIMPEYEDCRAAAMRARVPLRAVESAARAAYFKATDEQGKR